MNRLKLFLILSVTLAFLVSPIVAAPLSTVIYQDTFTSDGTIRLPGSSPNNTPMGDSALRWKAYNNFKFAEVNGNNVVLTLGAGEDYSAMLDTDLSAIKGTIRIEADIMPYTSGTNKTNWARIGFQTETVPAKYSTSDTAETWMLFRANGGYQIFYNGTNTGGDSVPGYTLGTVANVSITFNAITGETTYMINNNVLATVNLSGTAFMTAAKRPFFGTHDVDQYFDNFTISMEGATTALVNPSPAPVRVPVDYELNWVSEPSGGSTFTYDVYLGTDLAQVANRNSAVRIAEGLSVTSYSPALDYETTYYWLVDTLIDGDPNHPTAVGSFSTDYEEQKWTNSHWMTDADLPLSFGKFYTHAVKFNAASEEIPITVKGIVFEPATDRGEVGDSWVMTGAAGHHEGSTPFTGTGEGRMLAGRFFYGSPATITMNGLTPGVQYRTTLYSFSWGLQGARVIQVGTSGDNQVNLLDENYSADTIGRLFYYTYTAPESGSLTLSFDQTVYNSAWHHYAFSNELYTPVYLDPTPAPGGDGTPNITLSWQQQGEVEGTVTYNLKVATDPNMVNLVDDKAGLNSTSYPISLSPDTQYYWTVAIAQNGTVIYTSPVWDFITTPQPPKKWTSTSWMSDDDLPLSFGKTYTHLVNLNTNELVSTSVKGILFENDSDKTGANWSVVAPNPHSEVRFTGTGDGQALVSSFFYGNGELALTGLTPGVEYRTTLYTYGFGDIGGRFNRVTASDDGQFEILDGNMDGNGKGRLFHYTYVAPESGALTLTFTALTGDTWHQYAFSNEEYAPVYLDPTPLSGVEMFPSQLSWKLNGEVAEPVTYNLTVATDPNLVNQVINETGWTPTSYAVSLTPNTRYYWSVAVVEDGTVIYTSPVWNFLNTIPPYANKVLEWTFDETGGPIADQTGPSDDADGILTGFIDPNSTVRSAGLVNTCIRLNGASEREFVDISNAAPYMPTGDEQAFAISGYFRTFGNYGPVFSMRQVASGTPLIDIAIGLDGLQNEPGRLCLLVRDDTGLTMGWINSGIQVNDGQWHAFVVSRSQGVWEMYIDGVKRASRSGIASGAVTLDMLGIGAELRWIGDNWNEWRTHYRYFNGDMDEIVVWAGKMPQMQIDELAAVVPPLNDLNSDMAVDSADLGVMTNSWLEDTATPVQDTLVLEDMESYSYDPNDPLLQTYWAPPVGDVFGITEFSILDDPNDGHGKVLRMDYDFNGKTQIEGYFWLRDRRCDFGQYDLFRMTAKKLPGSTNGALYLDLYDGRGLTDPVKEELHRKGRIQIDTTTIPENQWVTLEVPIPAGWASGGSLPATSHDLYQLAILIVTSDTAGSGAFLLDTIELTDGTPTCVRPVVVENGADLNGDCMTDLADYARLAQSWLE